MRWVKGGRGPSLQREFIRVQNYPHYPDYRNYRNLPPFPIGNVRSDENRRSSRGTGAGLTLQLSGRPIDHGTLRELRDEAIQRNIEIGAG